MLVPYSFRLDARTLAQGTIIMKVILSGGKMAVHIPRLLICGQYGG